MSAEQYPEPLVPAEVDLRGLEYMPLLGARLFSSDFDLEATDAEFRAGLRLWWAAWNQVPAGSLPTSERALCQLAGLGADAGKWRKVRKRALHGFFECSDGRLHHEILAQQALIAWEKRAEDRTKRDNEAERKRRERADRSAMFEQLRAVGVVPHYATKTADLRDLVTKHVTSGVTRTATPGVTRHVTVTGTAKTGRDGTGQEKERANSTTVARAPDDPPPEANGHEPTPAGTACRAMRQAGLQGVNPGDPRLLALLEQGATVEEFRGIAAEAVEKRKGWAWVLTVVAARRQEASEIALAPAEQADPMAWAETRSGVINRAASLGLDAFDEVAAHVGTGPSWSAYRKAVIEADQARSHA